MRRTPTAVGLLLVSFAGPLLVTGTASAAELDAKLPPCVSSVVSAASAVPPAGSLVTVTGGSVSVHGGVVLSYVAGVEGPVVALVTVCDF